MGGVERRYDVDIRFGVSMGTNTGHGEVIKIN